MTPGGRSGEADGGESPARRFPALMAKTTSGLAASTESTRKSMRAFPSASLPTPKLMLSTSGQAMVLGEADGVRQCGEHAAASGDPALGVVGNLEPQQVGTGRHPIEAVTLYMSLPAAIPADVGAVAAGIEVEVEPRFAFFFS